MGLGTRGEPYLVGLGLSGRRVVVVGAGRVAERRLPRLLDAGAEVEVIAPVSSARIELLAAEGRVRLTERPYRDGDLAGAWYVLAATDEPGCNQAVSTEAERRTVFCVRSDDAAAGTAWTPATAVEDDVILAVLSRHAAQHGNPDRTRRLRDLLRARLRDLLSGGDQLR